MPSIVFYDTTLRDGAQGEGVMFSPDDKIRIAEKLDALGIDYIEGGWPGSNPRDIEFFQKIKDHRFKHAKITAFGSTRRADNPPEKDHILQNLLETRTEVVTIFGKSWTLHVREVLRITPEENLQIIEDSLAFLQSHGKKVIYDAEHFFDGYKDDPAYALATLRAAIRGGAETLVLCDTNGGILPMEFLAIFRRVREEIQHPLGIHIHNDSGVADAISLMAVEEGAVQVQGTFNGYGERCGNANLSVIIPNLLLKLNYDSPVRPNLSRLTSTSRFISELTNLQHNERQPYVGGSAFAHKAGTHADAVQKNPRTLEHISPELVGNQRRILLSDQAGRSTILHKAVEFIPEVTKNDPRIKKLTDDLKYLEYLGYQFEAAEASFELLIKKAFALYGKVFSLNGFRIIVEKNGDGQARSEATIKVSVDGVEEHTAADGEGPVNALDMALRKALLRFFPEIKGFKLVDYKVRVLEETKGTAAKVRVLIETTDGHDHWGTVGVSENIIEASWQALVDSIEYGILKQRQRQ